MYALGQTKLALDQRVAGDDEGAGLSKKTEEAGLQAVQDMVFAKLEQPDVVPDATDSKT
jgi:SWI/SNF-related matrix-associated actin-dependent regulator 1 of chromatin subfamily A